MRGSGHSSWGWDRDLVVERSGGGCGGYGNGGDAVLAALTLRWSTREGLIRHATGDVGVEWERDRVRLPCLADGCHTSVNACEAAEAHWSNEVVVFDQERDCALKETDTRIWIRHFTVYDRVLWCAK